jgi:hypothetical protein
MPPRRRKQERKRAVPLAERRECTKEVSGMGMSFVSNQGFFANNSRKVGNRQGEGRKASAETGTTLCPGKNQD